MANSKIEKVLVAGTEGRDDAWARGVNDPSLTTVERLQCLKAIWSEGRTERQNKIARSSLFNTEAERQAAKAAAPEIYAALEEQEARRRRTGSFEHSPLLLFALGYKTELGMDGRPIYGPFAYVITRVIRPRMTSPVAPSPIDYDRIQGSGGTFAERLYAMKLAYDKEMGCLNDTARPNLVK